MAETGKPMIISTGMANLEEITEAVGTARENGCNELVLLHCISSYPSPVEQANLATIGDITKRFNCIAGLSDHTMGTVVSVASIAFGACVIEKHIILSRDDKGPDSAFSLEPQELKTLCEDTEAAWKAIGTVGYERKQAEEANVRFRRSIYFVKNIAAGEVVTKAHIRSIRPGFGLAPKFYEDILGKKVLLDIQRGTATKTRAFFRVSNIFAK